tara:strand:- start:188 stop:526 length:339 start_codon:yes stop_codon:yes gene_type:complete
MESTRQRKVSRLIQKELSFVFQKENIGFLFKEMITVTIVRVSPDLGNANIFLSIFPSNNAEETLLAIQNNKKVIRKKFGEKVRNQLRIVPDLNFFIDDSGEYAQQIERLLKK